MHVHAGIKQITKIFVGQFWNSWKKKSGSKSFYEKHNFIAKFSKSHTQTNLGSHQNSTIKFFLAKIVDVSDQSY